MEVSIKCCIKQNNFHSEIFNFLEMFRKESNFLDVTIHCEDGDVKAHRVVLSLYSPDLYNKLKGSGDATVSLSFKNIPIVVMEALLEFMYEGEVTIDMCFLHDFVELGKKLRISGFPTSIIQDKNISSPNDTQNTGDQTQEDVKNMSCMTSECGDGGSVGEVAVYETRSDESRLGDEDEEKISRGSLSSPPLFSNLEVKRQRYLFS